MSRFKLMVVAAAVTVTSFIALPALVYAQGSTTDSAKTAVCEGVSLTGSGSDCEDSGVGVGDVIKFAINILSFVVGIAAIIMIIVGGFKYVTSGGESSNTASAKNTILYALVGLVIVAFAQTIVFFTLRRVEIAKDCPGSTHLDGKTGKCVR